MTVTLRHEGSDASCGSVNNLTMVVVSLAENWPLITKQPREITSLTGLPARQETIVLQAGERIVSTGKTYSAGFGNPKVPKLTVI